MALTGLLLALTVAGSVSPAPQPLGEEGLDTVLLVGCTRYPSLDPNLWLQGPANDVELIQRLLQNGTLGPAPATIEVLVGWPDDGALRPTRRNILAAMDDLEDQTPEGGSTLIYLAGHGSQQPDLDGDEIDGWDETFLPADVTGWDGQRGGVDNALVDDEIRVRLDRLRKRGVFVWLLVDACNSGTLSRGEPDDRARRITFEELMPREVSAGRPIPGLTRDLAASRTPFDLGANDSSVAMYAALPHELTIEARFPRRSSRYHGLFTYTLSEVLTQSRNGLSFRDLTEAVAERYRALGRSFPTPAIEGSGQDRTVFGRAADTPRPPCRLGRTGDTLTVTMGRIHGLQAFAVLSVSWTSADGEDEQLGYVEVVAAHLFAATVRPIAFGGLKAPPSSALPVGARCEIAAAVPPSTILRLGARPAAAQATEESIGNTPLDLQDLVASLTGESGPWRRAEEPSRADWLLHRDGQDLQLLRAAGEEGGGKRVKPLLIGSIGSAGLGDNLRRTLDRIARATRLLALAAAPEVTVEPVVDIELMRFHGETGEEIVPFETGGRVLHVGDEVGFRITNRGRRSADVTLLFVDAELSVEAVFPTRHDREYNRLKPGDSADTGRFRVTGASTGPEQLIIVATQAQKGQPVDLSYLADRGGPPSRGGRPATPLETFLAAAVDDGSPTRGLPQVKMPPYSVDLLQWITLPRAEPTH